MLPNLEDLIREYRNLLSIYIKYVNTPQFFAKYPKIVWDYYYGLIHLRNAINKLAALYKK